MEHESRLQSHQNRTTTSRATETPSECKRRLEDLRQPLELPRHRKGRLQSQRANKREVQHESRVESQRIRTLTRRTAKGIDQYDLLRE